MAKPKQSKPTKRKPRSKRLRQSGLPVDRTPIPTLTVRIKKKGIRGRPRKWDYDKLVSYVCDKIGQGQLVSDVCHRIGIRVPDFWRIAQSTEGYAKLYARSRKEEAEQMRIYAQKVAEGRDRISLKRQKHLRRLEERLRKTKNPFVKDLIRDEQHLLLQRNRLQFDAARWIAKVTDPDKFGDKSTTSLTSSDGAAPITIGVQFVNPDGKVVKL